MQYPGDAQDTCSKYGEIYSLWMSASNCARRAVSHSPFVDVMVNTSLVLPLKRVPTAVQFPDEAHDTD